MINVVQLGMNALFLVALAGSLWLGLFTAPRWRRTAVDRRVLARLNALDDFGRPVAR